MEGLADTDGDGFSDKWLVTAEPPDPPPPMDPDPYNARVCADMDTDGNLHLVARLKMTFEDTAQIKYQLARGTHDSLPLEGGGGRGTPRAARPSGRSAPLSRSAVRRRSPSTLSLPKGSKADDSPRRAS